MSSENPPETQGSWSRELIKEVAARLKERKRARTKLTAAYRKMRSVNEAV
jgi:hypothetical protein